MEFSAIYLVSNMFGTIKENSMFLTYFIGRSVYPNPFVSNHDVSECNGKKYNSVW